MRRRGRRRTPSLSAEINVTSLVDVALTLLVIFMITAPIMQGGVEVQVPRARSEGITDDGGVTVSVTRGGRIYIEEVEVPWEDFEPAIADAVQARQSPTVFLRADEGVEYGLVLQVLGVMKMLNVEDVALIAEQEVPGQGGGGER